jgi:hypothetical protein
MKKILMAIAAICAVGATNHANAQLVMNDVRSLASFATRTISPIDGEFTDASTINLTAINDFKKRFSTVENENWVKVSDGFYAKFMEGGIQERVAYNKKGKMMFTILEYNADKLAKDIRESIRYNYMDCSINHISEVHINNKVVYLVHISDEGHLKTIRVCDGNMEEVSNI